MTAHDFTSQPQGQSRYAFGIDCKNAAAAMRKLADDFDSGKIAIESARVQTLARRDDFAWTLVRIKFCEPRTP